MTISGRFKAAGVLLGLLWGADVLAAAEGGPLFVVAGRYHDRLALTDDGWRIVHRRLDIVWTEGNLAVVRAPRR